VLEQVGEALEERVGKFADPKLHTEEWNLRGLVDELSYLLMRPVTLEDLQTDRYEELVEKAVAVGERAYRSREEEFSPPVLRELERHLYLYTIDEHWRDHLYELDHLKGGINLRAYGQRDPLIEYKKEAFELFETLLREVREDFVMRLFRVQLAPEAMREMEPARPRAMVAQHAETQTFGSAPDEGDGVAAAQPAAAAAAPAMRTGPRVGRNDPCPCGSGKKYKKCHMLIDEGVGSGR
jgi:preprotein translocase subunit SecA